MTYTNFHDYSHAELRKMAQALNPGEVMAASDPWRRAADTLKAIRATLTRASTEAAVSWEGSTSDAFHGRMLNLAATINNAASYANDAANTLKAMSEAIAKAKHDMPEEPSGWDQLKDGVGDTVSSLFGGDDEDTKTAVAEQRKLEAAAVMQTLAMHYRVAAPMLKPPPPLQKGPLREDTRDVPSSDDSAGAPVLSAVTTGAGFVGAGASPTSGNGPAPRVQKPGSQAPTKPVVTKAAPAAPTDPGIKGGSAQPAPKPPSVGHFGPGTGIDGGPTTLPAISGSTQSPNPATPSSPTGVGHGGGPLTTTGGGPLGGGTDGRPVNSPGKGEAQGKVGAQGKDGTPGKGPFGRTNAPGEAVARGGRAFGTGEVHEGGFGTGGRAAAGSRPGGSLPGRAGAIIGEGARSVGGPGAKQSFTEGGSGIGARNRAARGEPVGSSAGGIRPGIPLGDTQRRKNDKDKGGKRPDYLVEDEETWASDKPSNPNVVE
ncbi:PPE domain-containing protein [Kitasatospora sp. NPDC003701]